MALDRWRGLITRAILPLSDLGIAQQPPAPLSLPGDIPAVLAIQSVMTPSGPRLLQADNSASANGAPLYITVSPPFTGGAYTRIIPAQSGKRIRMYYLYITAANAAIATQVLLGAGGILYIQQNTSTTGLLNLILPTNSHPIAFPVGAELGIQPASTITTGTIIAAYDYV